MELVLFILNNGNIKYLDRLFNYIVDYDADRLVSEEIRNIKKHLSGWLSVLDMGRDVTATR